MTVGDVYLVISYTFLITLITYNYFDIISKTQTRDKNRLRFKNFLD